MLVGEGKGEDRPCCGRRGLLHHPVAGSAWPGPEPALFLAVVSWAAGACFRMFVAVVGLEKNWCSTCLHWKSSTELALNTLVSRNALVSVLEESFW